MLELSIKQGRRYVPLFDLPTRLGHHVAAKEIGDTVEGLIAFLDDLGGDIDLEDNGDAEHDGTEAGDTSWTEWHTRGRLKDNPGVMCRDGRQCLEDMEDDDNDTCLAADDIGTASTPWHCNDGGPGTPEDAEDGHDREEDRGGY